MIRWFCALTGSSIDHLLCLVQVKEHTMTEQPTTLPVDVDDDLMPAGQAQAILDLLQSWDDDDPEEQRETWKELKRLVGEDRLSERPLFDEHGTREQRRR
jgi:hypothetical protein